MKLEAAKPGMRTPTRRRGRPAKGASTAIDTRSMILAAAVTEFSLEGYDATSMRAIARRAAVDPALVRHYFSDKADLFAEAIAVPMRPDRLVKQALAGPRDQIGATLVRSVLTSLDEPEVARRLIRVLHTALGQEFAARMLRQFVIREVLKTIATELSDEDAELRASFASTQLLGLVVARYGLRIEPLVSATPDDIVARVGPVVQWHLMGNPLP